VKTVLLQRSLTENLATEDYKPALLRTDKLFINIHKGLSLACYIAGMVSTNCGYSATKQHLRLQVNLFL